MRLGAAVAPKEIEFLPSIPKTRSGKIMRRLLKARELGLPEGDISTLESLMSDARGITTSAGQIRRHLIAITALELLREMLRIRRFEEKCAELYSAGKIRGFLHLYIGEEAVAVGAMQALHAGGRDRATYREHGHALARGIPIGPLMAEMYGKAKAAAAAAAARCTSSTPRRRFYGGNAIVGGGLPIAVGLALADKMQRRRGSPRASSVTARSPKASSTSR